MPRPNLNRPRRPWCIAIAIAVAVVVIVVIVVPCAVILTRKKHHAKQTNVLYPLYIYPTNSSTWSPLYKEITERPDLNFTVIINPSSGPGNTTYPDEAYSTEVERLASYANVRRVGYVRTGYATRNISSVLADVSTYAGWANQSAELAMDGIFFDEAPYVYSADKVEYMNTINAVVKNSTGLQGERMVIHNPGTIPDSRYNANTTDVTVVFESSYDDYHTQKGKLNALASDRTGYSYMLHSVPEMGNSTLRSLVDQLSLKAEYLFLTTLTEDYYESFDPAGPTIIDLMPTCWIETHPDVEFLVIINPNSGPGDIPSPDPNYAREVARLNSYPNVYLIGYIRIDYCRKPLPETLAEIDRYAHWATDERPGLGLGGIMVDETPNHHTAERAEYLQKLHEYVKSVEGILRDRLVVHNPGTPPDPKLADPSPDLILVCEEPYPRYRSDEVQRYYAQFDYPRVQCGYMISEVPRDEVRPLVQELRHRAAYIFVTEIAGDFYERFGPQSWGMMMDALRLVESDR
ncbi:spherulation-specific family 4 protein [Aspergillus brunneoviolaceus CBS 621.78]|uniref:Uncharacterized protein n=1 Tax=Aspergillus brunneoviolaceus CBS 621.78 TaxID=1450534 RepID=A0ACD1FVV8_9EURO|nr:hypothetical protein BO95DRAFT_423443 [Aspergillus brunneoviolaceus CBS 621.78]RAH41110.1 hypothetical protein BO95DRAFT_423443 [Aspergillus brunneoviolaceus CBS 621.78]